MKKNFLISAVIGIVTGICNGFFGSGGGTVVVPCMEKFLKIEAHKAHATAIAIILPLSVISALMYLRGVDILWRAVLWTSVGGVVGGYIGAKLLNKVPTKWLHLVFGGFMLVAAVRMVF